MNKIREKKKKYESSQKNPNSKSILNIVVAISGVVLAFLTGSFIFYQIGKDSQSNSCEREKIILLKKIDSLKHEETVLQFEFIQSEENINNYIDKIDSIINENNRLRNIITESMYIKNKRIAYLIKAGKQLLENHESIQEWQEECISFLSKHYRDEPAKFMKKTNYILSSVGQRKSAIEEGISFLRSLN